MERPTKKSRRSFDLPKSSESNIDRQLFPRWVLSEESFNKSNIKCFLSKEQKDSIPEILRGEKLSSQIYPLLFDFNNDKENNKNVFYRSIPFLKSLLEEKNGNEEEKKEEKENNNYNSLSHDLQKIVHVGLRDLYFASLFGLLSENENEMLIQLTNIVEDFDSFEVEGLSISYYPSKNHKVLKYIDIPFQLLDGSGFEELFIQPTKSQHKVERVEKVENEEDKDNKNEDIRSIRAVFIDPRDLSYHNFESIVRLDSWFQQQSNNSSSPFPYSSTTTPQQIDPNYEIFTFHLQYDSNFISHQNIDFLHELDNLNLYTPPLNSSTRGGNRFIFQSQYLSKQLSQLIRSNGVLNLMSPSNLSPNNKYSANNSFISMNSVFRLNKFVPTDNIFDSHLDTPYSDPSHHHFSRYSILIYLSDGCNDGTLSFEEDKVKINNISDLMCVVFRQDYEHKGKPFIDNNKIFIRSELIFYIEDERKLKEDEKREEEERERLERKNKKNKTTSNNNEIEKDKNKQREIKNNGVKGINYDKRIGKLFSSAVYFTGQSVFEPELSQYAHKCYELSNKLHWNCQLSSLLHSNTNNNNHNNNSTSTTTTTENETTLLLKKIQFHHSSENIKTERFITCGSDYWFERSTSSKSNQTVREVHNCGRKKNIDENELYLKECVLVMILDYFNCILKESQVPFRSLCETTILSSPSSSLFDNDSKYQDFIWSSLKTSEQQEKEEKEKEEKENNEHQIININWQTSDKLIKAAFSNQKPPPKPNPKYCCPFHSYPEDDSIDPNREAAKVPSLNAYYLNCRKYTELKLRGSNMLLNWLGEDIVMNEESFLFEGDKIYVLNNTGNESKEANRVNFAACWNGGGMDSYVSNEKNIPTKRLLLPPIVFQSIIDEEEEKQRVHLTIDFFENNWSVTISDRMIPIPELLYNDEDATDSYRHEVHRNFFSEIFENSYDEMYRPPKYRTDLDGDTFHNPVYFSDGEVNDEVEEDDDNDTY